MAAAAAAAAGEPKVLRPEDITRYKTVNELFDSTCELHAQRPMFALAVRGPGTPYDTIMSHKQVHTRVVNAATGLKAMAPFMADVAGDKCVGITGLNSPAWIIGEQAALRLGYITVPVYINATPDQVMFVAAQCGLKIAFIDAMVLRLWVNVPGIKLLVVNGDIAEPMRPIAAAKGITIMTLKELEEKGAALPPVPAHPVRPDDIWSIVYTSGTTGTLKGVVMSHRTIMKQMEFCNSTTTDIGIDFRDTDVHYSYMPMAHVYERTFDYLFYLSGALICFFTGDPARMFDDIAQCKPSFYNAVPVVLSAIRGRTLRALEPLPDEQRQAFWADYKRMQLYVEGDEHGKKLDARPAVGPLFTKIAQGVGAAFGGRLRELSTGSAPVAPDLRTFFRIMLAPCAVVEGYGLTEHNVCNCTTPLESEVGTVGKAVRGCELKLVPLEDGRKEICIRSEGLFLGYYKAPAGSHLDKDGFFHTNDIGEFTPQGNLRILGRANHMLKMANGEFMVPDDVENVLRACPFVENVFVYGESTWTGTVAIIEPRKEAVAGWAAKALQVPEDKFNLEAVVAMPAFSKFLLDALVALVRQAQMPNYYMPRAIIAQPGALAKYLTPTRKLRRYLAAKDMGEMLRALYHGALTAGAGHDAMAEASATAKKVAAAWCAVLGLKTIDMNASFFETGGNSVRAMELYERLQAEFKGKEFPITTLFQHPTVHTQATFIDSLAK